MLSVYHDLLYQPAIGPLLLMARVTERIRLGPAALNPFTLHPYEIAGQIALLDAVSDGRAYLGLAKGAWLDRLGLEEDRPLVGLREAVAIVRALLYLVYTLEILKFRRFRERQLETGELSAGRDRGRRSSASWRRASSRPWRPSRLEDLRRAGRRGHAEAPDRAGRRAAPQRVDRLERDLQLARRGLEHAVAAARLLLVLQVRVGDGRLLEISRNCSLVSGAPRGRSAASRGCRAR